MLGPSQPEHEQRERIRAGTRVEVVLRLLEPQDRAPGLPSDTAGLPYEARVRGMLRADAALGEEASVRTAAGRVLTGRVETIEPGDWHSFGRPVPALLTAIDAITQLRGSLR